MTGFSSNPWIWISLALAVAGLALAGAWRRARQRNRELESRVDRNSRNSLERDQRLQQARRMEAVGILAGGIVNNLNNLLAVILGNARLLGQDVKGSNAGREELDRVVKAGYMAGELVRELSDFYRQADQARKPTDLAPIVRDTVKLLHDILPTNVTVQCDLRSCGPVLATPTGIQQILMNLCSNSVQAMNRGSGTLEIVVAEEIVREPRRAAPDDLQPGSYVRMTVADDGRGMDNETLDRIFDSSNDADSTAPTPGLGLRTVRRILADHQGVSVARSSVGGGTRIDLYFPLIAWSVKSDANGPVAASDSDRTPADGIVLAELPAAPGSELPRGSDPRATVLLVDDEEMVAQVLTRGLRSLGYRVVMHTDSRKALADFSQTPEVFDIVVTDQIMPHKSGVRLIREIHDLRPGIPVIICTGFRDSFNEQQAREAGVDDFILKPTSHRDLAALIERLVRRKMEGRG